MNDPEGFKLVDLEHLDRDEFEADHLSHPNFEEDYSLETDNVEEYSVVDTKISVPSTGGYRPDPYKGLTSSIEDIEKEVQGYSDEDSKHNMLSSMSTVASLANSAESEADSLNDDKEEYKDAYETINSYAEDLCNAATDDIEELKTAIDERDALIAYLKEQLIYCLSLTGSSLKLMQAKEALMDLE